MDYASTVERIIEGVVLVGGTVLLQFLAQVVLEIWMRAWRLQPMESFSIAGYVVRARAFIAVLILMVTMLLQGGLWALVYDRWGELGSYGNAFYFSIASFSTVGASELSLSPPHRLVGALQAAIGVLMFGWSTALLVQVLQESRRHDTSG